MAKASDCIIQRQRLALVNILHCKYKFKFPIPVNKLPIFITD